MYRYLFWGFWVFCFLLGGCKSPGGDAEPANVQSLLDKARNDVDFQRFEPALEKALLALELSEGTPSLKVQALSTIVVIGIMANRDEDAWKKALEAEVLARKHNLRKELSAILISKAKLCSYAEISPETGRNDEGLGYATEALDLALEAGALEEQCEACYIIGSLYINKNRWSSPLDDDIYRTAGMWLDRGQALADSCDSPKLRRNGVLFRSRWFQQGGCNEEAIRFFEQERAALNDSDHLTASSLDDRLVRLYSRTGRHEDALDTHDDYVLRIQKYMLQRQDDLLQEMDTRFRVQMKERVLERYRYRLSLLVALLLAAAALIALGVEWLRRIHRRNAELQCVNDSKEQIIGLLSKDLRNPANTLTEEISKLSARAPGMTAEQIHQCCQELTRSAESINDSVARYVGDLLVERSRRIADIGLSHREIEVIRLSAEGCSALQIAERLFLSVHTVNTHRQRIYAKLDVRNVSDMIRKATELGIL